MKNENVIMKDTAIKTLAVVGLLAILALASFMTLFAIRYVPVAWNAAAVTLSSIFYGSDELTVTASPSNVQSGQPFTLSYKSSDESGVYELSYSCVDGVTIEVSDVDGKKPLVCNSKITLGAENSVIIIPTSANNRYADLSLDVTYKKEGEDTTLSETATVTITNLALSTSPGTVGVNSNGNNSGTSNTGSSGSTNTGSANTGGGQTTPNAGGTTSGTGSGTTVIYPVTPSTPINNPNGKTDFRPKILEVGVIDPISQKFVATSTLRRSDRVAVRFEVENIGDKISGDWNFNAILPTFPGHTFNSDTQPKLNPGDKIEYTIGFDRTVDGNQVFRVVVDGGNRVVESDENNNSASVNLTIL